VLAVSKILSITGAIVSSNFPGTLATIAEDFGKKNDMVMTYDIR